MVISVYEKEQLKRLNDKGIVIETIYYNTNQRNSTNLIRSTDGKILDNVIDKAIKEKRYFFNDKCIYRNNKFDKNIHYTFLSYNDENEVIVCPNCNYKDVASVFALNCPYCGTNFNFGINDINIAKKNKIFQIILFPFWILYFISIILLFYFKLKLFNPLSPFDSTFVNYLFLIIELFSGMVALLFITSILSIIFINIKTKKDPSYLPLTHNDQRNIWILNKNEKTFYNNFYTELMLYLFKDKDLIDFDIIKYSALEFLFDNEVNVYCEIKKVYYTNNIKIKKERVKVTMRQNEHKILTGNYQVISCPNCGSSIDISDPICKYCHTINNYKKDWILVNIDTSKTE